jgi:hypothetical protein
VIVMIVMVLAHGYRPAGFLHGQHANRRTIATPAG